MSTLALTFPPDQDSKPDFRHPHDFPSSSSFSSLKSEMTSNPHRGLPPPAAINLPDPIRPAAAASSHSTALPAAPSSWHGADDSMRIWLSARMEDDKRRQEEARLGQEQCKLEQRRLEGRMLNEALQSNIPPHLIPIIFAGLGASPLAASALEYAQQHLAQLQQQAAPYTQHPQTSPDMRQDLRMAQPPQYLASQPSQQQPPTPLHPQQLLPQALPGQALPQQPANLYPTTGFPSPQSRNKPTYGPPIQQYAPHTASARGAAQSTLPRLATNDPGSSSQPGYSQQQEQNSPSSNIYFHHWQPPAPNAKEMKDAGKPPTNPPWRVSGQDFSGSPRGGKRKATGSHEQRAAPPTSNPATTTSPTYSQGSSASGRSHRRQTSRDSMAGQRRAYDVIERRNARDTREPSSRDNSTSGRSRRSQPSAEPASRHETPREVDEEPDAKAGAAPK